MAKLTKYIIYLVIVIVFIYIIYLLSATLFNSSKQNLDNFKNKVFKASTKYVDSTFKTSNDGQTLYVTVNYKDLNGVSAVHIHANKNGSPGPILAWLGTTDAWQNGVTQNTPGSNDPCCNKNNPLCTLVAPNETPSLNNLSNSVMNFTVENTYGSDCPWINNGTFLVIHGFNFQKVVNGKLTNEKPGLDVIDHTAFTM